MAQTWSDADDGVTAGECKVKVHWNAYEGDDSDFKKYKIQASYDGTYHTVKASARKTSKSIALIAGGRNSIIVSAADRNLNSIQQLGSTQAECITP